jgi:serine/threonine protein kinase
MKKINLKNPINWDFDNILMEINACGVCKHPNIAQYVDHYYDEKNECVCLVLELCEYGSLSRILELFKGQYPDEHISEEVLFKINYLLLLFV